MYTGKNLMWEHYKNNEFNNIVTVKSLKYGRKKKSIDIKKKKKEKER